MFMFAHWFLTKRVLHSIFATNISLTCVAGRGCNTHTCFKPLFWHHRQSNTSILGLLKYLSILGRVKLPPTHFLDSAKGRGCSTTLQFHWWRFFSLLLLIFCFGIFSIDFLFGILVLDQVFNKFSPPLGSHLRLHLLLSKKNSATSTLFQFIPLLHSGGSNM